MMLSVKVPCPPPELTGTKVVFRLAVTPCPDGKIVTPFVNTPDNTGLLLVNVTAAVTLVATPAITCIDPGTTDMENELRSVRIKIFVTEATPGTGLFAVKVLLVPLTITVYAPGLA